MMATWHRMPLPRELRAQLASYEDMLRRLLRDGFADLTPAQRRARAEAVLRLSASAATALAAAPVPFLELPIHAAMVQALARIYGVRLGGRQALLYVAAALGGGLALRQWLRFVPLGGSLPLVARVYAATWALGRAAQAMFERGEALPAAGLSRPALHESYTVTFSEQRHAAARRMAEIDFAGRLEQLERLRRRRLITAGEYGDQRRRLLALL